MYAYVCECVLGFLLLSPSCHLVDFDVVRRDVMSDQLAA